MAVGYGGGRIEWLGYATARVEAGGTVAYTDPGRYGVLDDYWARDGDLVVVTHDHHYDPDGIASVAADGATVVVYEGVDAARIDRDVRPVSALASDYDLRRVGEEERIDLPGAAVRSVPAYNEPDGPCADETGTVPHPRGFGCGFRLALGAAGRAADAHDLSVFWPGDSDALDGFAEIETDVFLANIGGGGIVSDRHDAAALAGRMDPGLVVPIHYDTFEALEADGGAFAADVAGRSIPVALDERSVGG
jgi:L-ascorbate metabolism protein UlaG (beta-lactamase superfamily)